MLESDAKAALWHMNLLKLHSTNPCEHSPAARYTHAWRSGIPIATKAKRTMPKTIYIYYITMFYGYHHGFTYVYINPSRSKCSCSNADQIGPITFSHAGIESLTWLVKEIGNAQTHIRESQACSCWMVMLLVCACNHFEHPEAKPHLSLQAWASTYAKTKTACFWKQHVSLMDNQHMCITSQMWSKMQDPSMAQHCNGSTITRWVTFCLAFKTVTISYLQCQALMGASCHQGGWDSHEAANFCGRFLKRRCFSCRGISMKFIWSCIRADAEFLTQECPILALAKPCKQLITARDAWNDPKSMASNMIIVFSNTSWLARQTSRTVRRPVDFFGFGESSYLPCWGLALQTWYSPCSLHQRVETTHSWHRALWHWPRWVKAFNSDNAPWLLTRLKEKSQPDLLQLQVVRQWELLLGCPEVQHQPGRYSPSATASTIDRESCPALTIWRQA